MSALNILLDVTFSAKFSSSDTGGGETYTGSASFKADKVTYTEKRDHSDHSTAQDLVANHRKKKYDWTLVMETKLTNAIFASVCSNDLMELIGTASNGLGIDAKGLIADWEEVIDAPSTYKVTLVAHGTAVVFS